VRGSARSTATHSSVSAPRGGLQACAPRRARCQDGQLSVGVLQEDWRDRHKGVSVRPAHALPCKQNRMHLDHKFTLHSHALIDPLLITVRSLTPEGLPTADCLHRSIFIHTTSSECMAACAKPCVTLWPHSSPPQSTLSRSLTHSNSYMHCNAGCPHLPPTRFPPSRVTGCETPCVRSWPVIVLISTHYAHSLTQKLTPPTAHCPLPTVLNVPSTWLPPSE
jgi:hypothetical protein